MKVRAKLFCLSIIPLTAVLVYGLAATYRSYHVLSEANAEAITADLIASAATSIYEVGKERLLVVKWVDEKLENDRSDLDQQREDRGCVRAI